MKKIAMFAFAIALGSVNLHAQQPRTVKSPGGYVFTAPSQEVPAALTKIFSNLGPKTDAFTYDGWSLDGPNSSAGFSQFAAMAFTPKKDAHVSQLRAAVQYNGTGANQVNLSLYSDSDGAPGVLLAGPVTVTNLPVFYTCCTLAIANFTAVAVTAGTQYWVVADTPATGTGSDFNGAWAFIPPYNNFTATNFDGNGWYAQQGAIFEPAGAVYGTIP